MSKIHSKTNKLKTLAIVAISLSIVTVFIQIYFSINSILSSRKDIEKTADPVKIQQQNIKKAYDFISNQTTLKIDNKK